MKPIGPMMREHRLIERMLALLERELTVITSSHKAAPRSSSIPQLISSGRMRTGRTTERKRRYISGTWTVITSLRSTIAFWKSWSRNISLPERRSVLS